VGIGDVGDKRVKVDREEKEVNDFMTLNGTASSWEPMELRLVGQVEEVMLGGVNNTDCSNIPPGKTVPSPSDPGEPCLKPPGQE
jgi:hypothetical protein